jgi:hypothetical protein
LEIRGSQANLDAIKLMVPYIVESTNAEGTPILTVDDTIKEEEGRFRISVELGEYKE